MDLVLAELGLPKLFPVFYIQSGCVGGSVVDKAEVDPFSVRGEGTIGMGGLFVLFIELTLVNFGDPDVFTRAAIQGNGSLGFLFLIGSQQKDFVSCDDGGTVPTALNAGLPLEVFGGIDFFRQKLRPYSGTIVIRASPPGPVIGVGLGGLCGKDFIEGFFGDFRSEFGLGTSWLSQKKRKEEEREKFCEMHSHSGER